MKYATKDTYTVSNAFPVYDGETIVIRDGRGRPVERWTVLDIDPSKTHKVVTFGKTFHDPSAGVS